MVNVRELLAKATKATAYMYDREATVTRNVTVVKPNGAETEQLETIYDAIPCRISYPQTSTANAAQGDVNTVAYDAKMFCSPEYELKAGDTITVDNKWREWEAPTTFRFADGADESRVYVTHQEVLLRRGGIA